MNFGITCLEYPRLEQEHGSRYLFTRIPDMNNVKIKSHIFIYKNVDNVSQNINETVMKLY